MNKTLKKFANKKIEVIDAKTTPKEIFYESLINFSYGFVGNLMVPFIVAKSDVGILLSFGMYYMMLSYILNRARYTTKFARFGIMPITCVLGAFAAIKVGFLISEIL